MRIYIGVVLAIILASGCKKENHINKLNESIQGTWELQSNKLEYFNSSNQKKYEEVIVGNGTFKEVVFSNNLKSTVKVENDEKYNSKYNIVNYDAKWFLEFYDLAVFNSRFFEIATTSPTAMTWKVRFTDIEYEDAETSETFVAAYGILTLELVKINN